MNETSSQLKTAAEFEHLEEYLQMSRNRFMVRCLSNAAIHSSDMKTAEKKIHLQFRVKDEAKAVIREFVYNGDMYFFAHK